MSTPAMNVLALDADLNKRISSGDVLGAFDTYYDDEVVMQENTTEPRVGKPTCRQYEEAFLASVEQFHGATLLGSVVNGDLSYSEWEFDATYKGAGKNQADPSGSATVEKRQSSAREVLLQQGVKRGFPRTATDNNLVAPMKT